MSRLDDLGEILEGYEGRKRETDRDHVLSTQDIKEKLCAGSYEDRYRAGLLVGKRLPDDRLRIVDIIVPEQNSCTIGTVVKNENWDAAVHKAEAIGELAGSVFYVASEPADLSESARAIQDFLCKKYGMEEVTAIINNKNEFRIYSNRKIKP